VTAVEPRKKQGRTRASGSPASPDVEAENGKAFETCDDSGRRFDAVVAGGWSQPFSGDQNRADTCVRFQHVY
jgi:hypothetical protein